MTRKHSGGQKVSNNLTLRILRLIYLTSYLAWKARLTLARAIYSHAQTLLLDDVSAAQLLL